LDFDIEKWSAIPMLQAAATPFWFVMACTASTFSFFTQATSYDRTAGWVNDVGECDLDVAQ
jgi:hypothetical protein